MQAARLVFFTLEESREIADLRRDDRIVIGLRHNGRHTFTAFAFRLANDDLNDVDAAKVEMLTAVPMIDVIFDCLLGPGSELARFLTKDLPVYCLDHRKAIDRPCVPDDT